MKKILLDMNLSPRWQSTYSDTGIESVHWSEVGDSCAFEESIASYTASNVLLVKDAGKITALYANRVTLRITFCTPA